MGAAFTAMLLPFSCLDAQVPSASGSASASLDALVAQALTANPDVNVAYERIDAARARVAPAASLPDPMLSAGVMNVPVTNPGFGDMMTMTTIAIQQTLPYPGKRSLARGAAEWDVRASEARLRQAQLDVASQVKKAYYELAELDKALEVLTDNQAFLVSLTQLGEARYAAGVGSQEDVLETRIDAARLAEEAAAMTEERSAALIRLNLLVDRPIDEPIESPRIPEAIARAAVLGEPDRIRFASGALGARVADSPLPPLEQMQRRAVENSPMLRLHDAEIQAQVARLGLAGKAAHPDFDVSISYGQRVNNADMVSAMVSLSLPIHRAERQEMGVSEARADLEALEFEHRSMLNQLSGDVASRYAALERGRAQLALYVTAIIPQGRAALASATAGFRTGRVDFMTVMAGQTTLYSYEIAYVRALADFAKELAELERTVGAEVLP